MRTILFVILTLVLLFSINNMACADWDTDPATNDVMVVYNGNQEYMQAISDGSGGAFVAWGDDRNSGTSGDDVYIQRVSGIGSELWDTNGTAVCTQNGLQNYPFLVSDGGSGVMVFWTDQRSGNSDIYGQRYDVNGNEQWTSGGKAIVTGANNQSFWYSHYTFENLIVKDGSGGAYITYLDNSVGNKDFYLIRIDGDGDWSWGSPVAVGTNATHNEQSQRVIQDGTGGCIVAWDVEASDRSVMDVYVQKFNGSGTAQWSPSSGVLVASRTGGDTPWPAKPGDPEIVSDGSGGVIVVYSSYPGVGSGDLYMQRVNSSGTLQWFHTPSGTTYNGYVLADYAAFSGLELKWDWSIEPDGNGDYFIVWADQRNIGTTSFDIYAQKIDVNGTELWTSNGHQLLSMSEDQEDPDMLVDSDGNLLLAWADNRNTGTTNYDIYGMKVDTNGNIDGSWTTTGNTFCIASGHQYEPKLVPSGTSGFIAMWTDDRNAGTTGTDIFGSFISFDDGLLGGVGTLPVTWAYLEGVQVKDHIEIKWATSDETNNSHFDVERGSDGLNFSSIGRVYGNGTTEILQEYRFADRDPAMGIAYYRLKQVDFDGSFEFSRIVPVQFNEFINVFAYPNPAKDQFTVEIAEDDVWFEMFNATGRQETMEMEIRDGRYRFSTHYLSKGLYFLKVHTPGAEETVKVVIE